MMLAAVLIDQLDPPSAEALKSVDLRRVDHIFNDAGDHASSLKRLPAGGRVQGNKADAIGDQPS